jgi:hypothetical protein
MRLLMDCEVPCMAVAVSDSFSAASRILILDVRSTNAAIWRGV